MTHAIARLQETLVTAWRSDAALTGLLGGEAVFDAPPRGFSGAFVAIGRHDAISRDGDLAPITEHRVLVNVWHQKASRASALEIVERVVAVAMGANLNIGGLGVRVKVHVRTDTEIDAKTGRAKAAVSLKFISEPA